MHHSTFYVKSYGCQMNIYDSEKIISILENIGFKQNESAENADLVVFNTCNIRDKAAHKLYSDIGRVNKYRKEKTIAVVGRVAQAENSEMFNKNKFIADYSKAYDVYFYVNSGTRVANQVFDSNSDSSNKRTLKKMFMSGMKNRINSRVLLQNFIKEIA